MRVVGKAWILISLLLGCVTYGQGQSSLITEPPPPISMPDWREEEVTDDFTEYSVILPSAVVSAFPENNVIPLRIFLPATKRSDVPMVVVLHYWGASDLRPERSLATELARRGIGAAIMTLPYHLSRTPQGRRSGDMAIQADVSQLKGTTQQSVLDVRRVLDFLESRPEVDRTRIGLSGTSLGALVIGLVFAVDQRVASATFILGGADFAKILWSSSRVVIQRDALRRRGYTQERLREELRDVEPLTYLPNRQGGTTFVIAAKFDTVIPMESTTALIDALPDPQVLWLDTGHYGGIFVQRRLMREVAGYFASQFTEAKYTIPTRLYAPTLRVGIKADSPNGVDVALGLDLFRFDANGETFASLLVTPRGPYIFAGRKITPVLAGGAFFNTRSIGLGIFWSTVL